jgi:antitoxin HigA-1
MTDQDLAPISPGEILLEEFLKPMRIGQNALARAMRVPLDRIDAIVHGRRVITADTALRLSIALGTTPEFCLNLQCKYNLEAARSQFGGQVAREVIPLVR